MGTRSTIAVFNPNETTLYDSIYSHYDGYPSGVGVSLQKHYTQLTQVNQLMRLGDTSGINPDTGASDAYNDGSDMKSSLSLDDLRRTAKRDGTEWLYIFEDGKWITEKVVYK